MKKIKYHNQIWSKKEKNILLKHWRNYNQRELHNKFLPDKTPVQICQKKMYMGLKKGSKWSKEERSIVLRYGVDCSNRQIADKFLPNKTRAQVSSMRKNLVRNWGHVEIERKRKCKSS